MKKTLTALALSAMILTSGCATIFPNYKNQEKTQRVERRSFEKYEGVIYLGSFLYLLSL